MLRPKNFFPQSSSFAQFPGPFYYDRNPCHLPPHGSRLLVLCLLSNVATVSHVACDRPLFPWCWATVRNVDLTAIRMRCSHCRRTAITSSSLSRQKPAPPCFWPWILTKGWFTDGCRHPSAGSHWSISLVACWL